MARPTTDRQDDRRQEVALFRFRLVGDLAHLPPGSPELLAALRERAAVEQDIPGRGRRRIARNTLRRWLRLFRQGGFEALYPKRRSDRGQLRSMPPEVADLLREIKERNPQLTVRLVIRRARESGRVPETLPLALSTVGRLLRQSGLMGRAAGPGADRRRFSYRLAGELWMTDVMHGPQVRGFGGSRRRRAKSYLLAFIDDATRVVPHAAFAFSEGTASFLPAFKQALLRRGLPLRLYAEYVPRNIFHDELNRYAVLVARQ